VESKDWLLMELRRFRIRQVELQRGAHSP
jgi:hypothetical protein